MSGAPSDLAPCGLARLDRAHRIRWANARFRDLTGRGAAELALAPAFFSLLTVAGRIVVQTRILPDLALNGRVDEVALDLVRPDGERGAVLLNAVQARGPDGAPGDIHLALFGLCARHGSGGEAPTAREVAEAAAQVRADFLANVSHEIRTPLNGMIGVAAVLQRTGLTDEQREMVELIQSSGVILERLVSDILDVSKVEAGGLALDPRAIDLTGELAGVLDVARIHAADKGLAFHHHAAPEAQGRFFADAVRLKQIVGNLTSNAIKFTETGSVSVTVDVSGPAGAEMLELTVEDTGIGFDEAVGGALFQRFHQADAGITRRYGGTGLGLSICKALIDLMGGTVAVRSAPGRGTVFRVRIPVQRLDAAPAGAPGPVAPAAPVQPSEGGGRRLRILLAEDHPANQKVVQLMLAPHDVDLTTVENGALGVEAWRAGGFDVVLMDMQMPVMDGLTAIRRIRQIEAAEPHRTPTPIIVLSANAMERHRQEALDAGADLHVTKPITPASLLGGIEEALQIGGDRLAACG